MNALVIIAICCTYTAQATIHELHGGGGGGGGNTANVQLSGVPDISSYEGTNYPAFDIQDLGTETSGDIGPTTIQIHDSITVKEPQPYPVQVPHPVPYPVHVPKPVPVTVTKIVKVPHKVPVEVIKHVHVPVEVPKPYPVPSHEHSGGGGDHHDAGASLGHGDWGGHAAGLSAFGHEGQADQSGAYAVFAPAQFQGIQEAVEDKQ